MSGDTRLRPRLGTRHLRTVRDVLDVRRDGAPELPDVGSENRLAAFCLAGLLGVGAVLGLLNLVIDGAVRTGPTRPVYVAAMALLLTGLLGVFLAGLWWLLPSCGGGRDERLAAG